MYFNNFILIRYFLILSIIHSYVSTQNIRDQSQFKQNDRNLQTDQPQQVNQPIRITYSIKNESDNNEIVDSFKAVRNFLQQLIKIKQDNQLVQVQKSKCPEIFQLFYPSSTNPITIENSDLQIYIIDSDAKNKYSQVCQSNSLNGRPMAGVIYLNFKDLKTDLSTLKMEVILQELLQILIFTKENFMNYRDQNGKPYPEQLYTQQTDQLKGQGSSVILSFPRVLQEVRNHFDCPTLEGVFLENEINDGDEQSKWRYLDKGLFFNEISTFPIKNKNGDFLYQKPIFSSITIALFQDSNWYAEIDQQKVDPLYWGKKQGCSFINQQKKIYSGKLNKEFFCDVTDEIGIQINNHFGVGKCSQGEMMNTLSYYKYQQSDLYCISNGERSFMFSNQIGLCKKSSCEIQTIDLLPFWKIVIEGLQDSCNQPKQSIKISDDNLICPTDFNSFCGSSFLFCKSNCSNNQGLCISGRCFCNDNYFGPECQCKKDDNNKACIQQECDLNHFLWANCSKCNSSQKDKCLECIQGFVQVNGLCEPCGIKGCSICTYNTKYRCQVCKNPYHLFGNNLCVDECPNGFYPKIQSDNSRQCAKCHSDCKNCTGPTEKDCTVCSDPLLSVFLPLSQSSIKTGECKKCPIQLNYYIESSFYCKSCDNSCQTCNGPTNKDCIQCKIVPSQLDMSLQKFKKEDNICGICKDNQYGDSIKYQCVDCHQDCEKCVGPNNNDCLSCKKNNVDNQPQYRNFEDNTCQKCDETKGFYIEDNICKKCHPLCQTCKGPYVNDCKICSDGFVRPSCMQCSTGFYFDNIKSQKCIACHEKCDECIGGSEKDCTKCAQRLFIRQNPSNLSLCGTCDTKNNEYANSIYNKCMKCHPSCSTCIGSLPDQCLTCKQQNYYIDINFKVCRQCLQTQYVNKDNFCINCDPSCLTCKGPSKKDCLSCINQDHSIDQDGICRVCVEGEYKDSNNFCKPCNANCQGCSSQSVCTSCRSESKTNFIYLNYDGKCVESCLSGTYQDKINKLCIKCDPSCKECYGLHKNECISCFDNGALQKDKSCDYCEPGKYLREDVNACGQCDQTCETCINKSDQCILCTSGYYKYTNGKCYVDCKQDEVKVEVDPITSERVRRCDKCHSSCQSCVGTSQFQCLACKEGYYRVEDTNECVRQCPEFGYFVDNNQCIQCKKNCIKCQTIDTCSECKNGFTLFKQYQECMEECPSGMYSKEKVCYNCTFSCKTCSSSDKCLSCISNFYLSKSKGTCEEKCGLSEYQDTVLFECTSCKGSFCQKCNGPPEYNCVQCQTGKNKKLDGTCGDCAKTEYSEKGECRKCNPSCNECIGPDIDQCRSCNEGSYLNSNKCLKCSSPTCKTCLNSTNCKTCITNSFLDERQQCVPTCPSSFYGDSISQTCKPCGQNCFNCSERRGCTECKLKSQYKVRDSLVCVDRCSLNDYVQDDEKRECVKKVCEIQNCDQCDYINQICKKCAEGYNIASQSKQCIKCGPDEYFYYQFERCVKNHEYCDSQCSTCNGPTSLDCIECKNRYKQERLSKFYCVENCDTDYYRDQISKTCKPCFKYKNQCVQSCPNKTFIQKQICTDCNESCITCYGPSSTNCLSCSNNLMLWQDGSCQKFCPSNQCPLQGKCQQCQKPDSDETQTKSSSKYLQIASFQCVNNCSREENFASRIGNVEKVTSIMQVSLSIINFSLFNIDGFMQLQMNQQIGNLVFGKNSGPLGVGEYQLKHSFMSNFINWIPNTFLDVSTSSSKRILAESKNTGSDVKINLYSSEVADQLKINHFNKYFYQNCFFLLLILAILLVTYLCSQFLEFHRVSNFIKWNGALIYQFLFSNFTYISIFHAYQADSPGYSRDDFDLALASLVLIYQTGFLIYQCIIINTRPAFADEKDEDLTEEQKSEINSISLLRYCIRQNSFWTRNYWIFYECRKFLNSLLIITTKGHQGAVWVLMLINLSFVLYVYFKKPFSILRYQRMSVFNEIIIFLIYACFGFSISLSVSQGGLTFSYFTSILIVSNFIINVLFSIFSIFRKLYPTHEFDNTHKEIKDELNQSPPKKETEMSHFDGQFSSLSSIPHQERIETTTGNNKKLFKSQVSQNHYAVRHQNFLNPYPSQ